MSIQNSRLNILDLTIEEIEAQLSLVGEKNFRTTQIVEWIYQKSCLDFSQMANLSKELRDKLNSLFCFPEMNVMKEFVSEDGTFKLLFELADGETVETVLIPTKTRNTICVSTQAGCKFGCRFCASGIGGWKRNLSAGEIIGQILHVKKILNDKNLTHIVFMGVGEPLDNYDDLLKAIRMINHPQAINIGARRITVSTCGVIPKILQLGREGIQVELAISLHGYDNDSRNVLMPVNKKYPFDQLLEACRDYQQNYRRQITFEYILIKDVTCSDQAVQALRKSFKGLLCKMNLIPYNPVNEFDHQTPSRREMFQFRDKLLQFGVHATIRTPRGKDINSACGQLRHSAKV